MNNVILDGAVEKWLVLLEEAMFVAVKKQMMITNANYRGEGQMGESGLVNS